MRPWASGRSSSRYGCRRGGVDVAGIWPSPGGRVRMICSGPRGERARPSPTARRSAGGLQPPNDRHCDEGGRHAHRDTGIGQHGQHPGGAVRRGGPPCGLQLVPRPAEAGAAGPPRRASCARRRAGGRGAGRRGRAPRGALEPRAPGAPCRRTAPGPDPHRLHRSDEPVGRRTRGWTPDLRRGAGGPPRAWCARGQGVQHGTRRAAAGRPRGARRDAGGLAIAGTSRRRSARWPGSSDSSGSSRWTAARWRSRATSSRAHCSSQSWPTTRAGGPRWVCASSGPGVSVLAPGAEPPGYGTADHAARSSSRRSGALRQPSASDCSAASMMATTAAPWAGDTGFIACPRSDSPSAA